MAVINALLSAGANVNLATNGGNTPIQEAALQGSVEITKLLLANGADINATNEWNETAWIVGSLKNGSAEVTQLLIDAGADITAKDIACSHITRVYRIVFYNNPEKLAHLVSSTIFINALCRHA